MNVTFHYKKIWLPKVKTLQLIAIRPIIPITICYLKSKVRYEALIDSGADCNIFEAQLGELIGLNVKTGIKRQFGGITGQSAIAYMHKIVIAVDNYEVETECGFSEDISMDGCGILGQNGFFNHFKIYFDRSAEIIQLSPKIKH